MATHYYPGVAIELADDIRWQHAWSNDFVRALPKPVGEEDNFFAEPGDDRRRPATEGGTIGGSTVMFSVLGQGRYVDVWLTGNGRQGSVVSLFRRTGVGTDTYTVAYTGEVIHRDTWVKLSTRNTPGRSSGSAAGLRLFLLPGETYYLDIGSGSYDNAGAGFDQFFILQVEYTPLPLPDNLANAHEVGLPASGGSWSSDPIMNDGLSTFPDPGWDNNGLFWAAYWTFTPLTYSLLAASFTVLPSELLVVPGDSHLALQMWERLADGTMAPMGRVNPYNGVITPIGTPVKSGHTYFFAIGWTNGTDPVALGGRQKYQLQVATAPADEPPPDPEDPGDPGGQTHPLLSTLIDGFTAAQLDTGKWSNTGAGVPGSAGYALTGGTLSSTSFHYLFDSAYVRFAPVAGQLFNGSFLVMGNAGSPPCSAGFAIYTSDNGSSISASWSSDDGSADWTPTAAYDPAAHAWLRVRTEARQDSGDWFVTYICETAPALGQWTTMLRSPEVVSPSFGDGVGATFSAYYGTVVLSAFNGTAAGGASVLSMRMPDGTYRTVGVAGQPLSWKLPDGTYRTWPGSTVPLYQRQHDGTWREVITP